MSSRRLLFPLLALVVSGCVAAAEKRATNTEAAHGAPPPAGGEPSAMQVIAGTPAQPEEATSARPAGKIWVRGYWHWTGVRYVWVPAHFEESTPAYSRPVPR